MDRVQPLNRDPMPGYQRRGGRFQVYVCCCPLTLALVPFVATARLLRYGTLRLLGRPVAWPWAA